MMFEKPAAFARALAKEPPFRLLARQAVKHLPFGIATKALWDVVARPHYLVGLIRGASEARADGIRQMTAIEFGVAAGGGLLEMQQYVAPVEKQFGVSIDVVGFDNGAGLPEFCGDYRDHPDLWQSGDYPMEEQRLRQKLSDRTRLIIGNISETLDEFIESGCRAPVGFISFDLDMWSSTKTALKVLASPKRNILKRVPLYFDDTFAATYHQKAGEYLAIREFNEENSRVVIDRYYNIKINRPFPEHIWTEKMYMAHDLDQIDRTEMRERPRVWL